MARSVACAGLALARPTAVRLLYYERPPFYMTGGKGRAGGLLVDLIHEVFARPRPNERVRP